MAAKKAIASRNTPADTPSSAVSSNSPFKNCTYVPAKPAMNTKSKQIAKYFQWLFIMFFMILYCFLLTQATAPTNRTFLFFCVPNQPLSAPKWQSGSSMTLMLVRHRTIESCGSMSSLHKAACARIQMFVPLHGQPNANDHMYTPFCSILILMYHKDGKFVNIKSERFC